MAQSIGVGFFLCDRRQARSLQYLVEGWTTINLTMASAVNRSHALIVTHSSLNLRERMKMGLVEDNPFG